MGKYKVLESLKRLFDHTTAEREDKLPEFFVELPIYKDLTEGRHDIILGAKGSGKSAILLMLHHSWKSGEILQDVYLLKATEHEGDPAFAEAFRDIEDVDESRMVNAWRAYFLNLLYRELDADAFVSRKDLKELRRAMEKSGCIIEEPGPLEKLWSWIITNFVPRVVRFGVSKMTPDGSLSSSVADLELGKGDFVPAQKKLDGTDLVLAFRKPNSVMTRDTWILLDRLDNVYPGDRAVERKVMRALLMISCEAFSLTRWTGQNQQGGYA